MRVTKQPQGQALTFAANTLVLVLFLYIYIWQFPFLPLGDLPVHVFMGQILALFENFKVYYEIASPFFPNTLWQLILGFLSKHLGALNGIAILLTINFSLGALGLYKLILACIDNRLDALSRISIFTICIFCQFHFFYLVGYLQYALTANLIPWVILVLFFRPISQLTHVLLVIFFTVIAFFMHFFGLVCMYEAMAIWEIVRLNNCSRMSQALKPLCYRSLVYLPGLLVCGILLILMPPDTVWDGPLIEYAFDRKLRYLLLLVIRPLPIFLVLLILPIIAYFINRQNILFKLSANHKLAALFCFLIYILCPNSIKQMVDADLRLLLIIFFFLIVSSLILVVQSRLKVIVLPLVTLLILILSIIYNAALSQRAKDFVALSKRVPDNNFYTYINFTDPKKSFFERAFWQLDANFYTANYHRYLNWPHKNFASHAPIIFETSFLRRIDNLEPDFFDFISPWGSPFSWAVEQWQDSIKLLPYLIAPKLLPKKMPTHPLVKGRKLIYSKYWVLMVKQGVSINEK